MAAQWHDGSVNVLLSILKEKKIIDQLSSSKRNEAIYKEVVEELKNNGLIYTVKQVRAKVSSLKTSWKTVRDNNNKSGRERKSCKFFEEMEDLWGYRPTAEPYFHLDNYQNNEDTVNDEKNKSCVDNTLKENECDHRSECDSEENGNKSARDILSNIVNYGESDDCEDNDEEIENMKNADDCQSNKRAQPDSFDGGPSTSKNSALGSSSYKTAFDVSNLVSMRKKTKVTKTENMLTKVLTQFREDSAEQEKQFIINEKKAQDEFLDELLKFETTQLEKSQAHELKVLELLMSCKTSK